MRKRHGATNACMFSKDYLRPLHLKYKLDEVANQKSIALMVIQTLNSEIKLLSKH